MLKRRALILIFSSVIFLAIPFGGLSWDSRAEDIDPLTVEAMVEELIHKSDYQGLRALGRGVMSVLAGIYVVSDTQQRLLIARIFYALGWKSEAAKEALLQDIHTQDRNLRIQVQYALGRVSNDDMVVTELLNNMRNDSNAYFRDKAACALAHDQMHLTDEQKVRLYDGLIESLRSDKLQVRRIAIKVLKIHTGQTKGFKAKSPPMIRARRVEEWGRWLEEYRSNI